jgi:hypothetical protein
VLLVFQCAHDPGITDAHGTPVWWRQEPGAAPIDANVLDSYHITWARFFFGGRYLIRDSTTREAVPIRHGPRMREARVLIHEFSL